MPHPQDPKTLMPVCYMPPPPYTQTPVYVTCPHLTLTQRGPMWGIGPLDVDARQQKNTYPAKQTTCHMS